MKLSERIEIVIYIFEQCKADILWFQSQQAKAEAEMTNLEHELEGAGIAHLTPPNARERSKLATRYQKERIRRRIAKDAIRSNQPLLKFLESDVGTKMLNQLKHVLGDLRRNEKDMARRTYGRRESHIEAPSNPQIEKTLKEMMAEYKKAGKP